MAQTFSVDMNACIVKQNDIVWGYADGEWDEEDFFDLSEYKTVEHIEKLVREINIFTKSTEVKQEDKIDSIYGGENK